MERWSNGVMESLDSNTLLQHPPAPALLVFGSLTVNIGTEP